MPPPDSEFPLDHRLNEWQTPEPPSDLEARVWRQVGRGDSAGTVSPFNFWLLRSAAAVLCVGLGALSVGLIGAWRLKQMERTDELRMARDYGQLLDPTASVAGPEAEVRLERDLLWLRHELNLSPAQFEQLKSLHEDSNQRLVLLAAELAQIRSTEAHWEAERKSKGDVDFLSYAFAANGAKTLNRMSAQTEQSLIDSAAAVLNSGQRRRYLNLLSLAVGKPGGQGL
jgi:hypothetical protein